MKSSSFNAPPDPLIRTTIPDLLNQRYRNYPDKEAAVVFSGGIERKAVTFSDLYHDSLNVATGLLREAPDLERGDRIALYGGNSIDLLILSFAIMRTGSVAAFPPFGLRNMQDFVGSITSSKCKGVMIQHGYVSPTEIDEILSQLPRSMFVVIYGAPVILKKTHNRVLFKNELLGGITVGEKVEVSERESNINADWDAAVFYTTGSTGRPKGVVINHLHLINLAVILADVTTLTNKDVHYCNSFIGHALSYICGVELMLVSGLKSVLAQPPVSDPGVAICDVIEKEGCTIALLFGSSIYDILQNPVRAQSKLKSLRGCLFSGQILNESHAKVLSRVLPGLRLINVYGTTETGFIALTTNTDVEEGFIGPACQYCEVKIINDSGDVVPVGEKGELLVRTPFLSRGYLREDGGVQSLTGNGWYSTDDIALMNIDEQIKIINRKADIINREGNKICPSYLEEIILKHAKVKQVLVIGVPDERLGDEICACVILEDSTMTSDEILDWLAERLISKAPWNTMMPKWVVPLEDFPRASSGKISRRKLREMMIAHLMD